METGVSQIAIKSAPGAAVVLLRYLEKFAYDYDNLPLLQNEISRLRELAETLREQVEEKHEKTDLAEPVSARDMR